MPNLGNGIQIDRDGIAFGNRIEGNYIGTDITGTADLGNSSHGVLLLGVSNNIVGGTTAAARNVISGNNGSGVFIGISVGIPADNRIEGNYIGTNAAGTAGISNNICGVSLSQAQNNIIGGTVAGAGNLIAFNGTSGTSNGGIVIFNSTVATGNSILANVTHSNNGLGIDLGANGVTANDAGDADTGANNLQNFPVLTQAFVNGGNTNVLGTLNSAPNTIFTIDFFSGPACDASGNGEGRFYRGQRTFTTDASGNAVINETLVGVTTAGDVITATATDPSGNTSEFSACRAVSPPCLTITVDPATLPSGTAGIAYSQTVTATGGVTPYVFSLTAGALPNGVTLTAGGSLSGAPTVFGAFNFTVRATDANNCTGERAYSLVINPPCGTITVDPAALPNGFVGTAYTQTFTQTGGAGAITWSVSAGSLPGGLSLNASTGLLSGNPTTAGSFTFTIKATDANGCTGTRQYTVIIGGSGSNSLLYYPLPRPIRLLDTRTGATGCTTPGNPLIGGQSLTQPARITCDGITIPANAAAVVGNATVINFISGGGFITLWPTGAAQPTVSNLNYSANQIIPNAFTVGLGASGEFSIFASGSTDFIVDITGYYAPPSPTGLYYHPLPSPIRLLDTRSGATGCATPGTPLQAAAPINQNARLTCNGVTIPNNATAVVGNATVVNFISNGGFITLWPTGANQPTVSNLNYSANQIIPNAFTVGLGASGEFSIFASGATDFIADITGYYSTDAAPDVNGAAGLLYNPLPNPIRLLDTRPGVTACTAPDVPLQGGVTLTQAAHLTCTGVIIPNTAQAVVGNATVVNFISGGGFITLWPTGAAQPTVSNLNYSANQVIPNAFTVGLSASSQFNIFASGATHFIVDLTGYFAP